MKAKEILHLCEEIQELKSNEAINLINNYFIKKFRLIGASVHPDPSTSRRRLSFAAIQFPLMSRSLVKKYLLNLIKFFPIKAMIVPWGVVGFKTSVFLTSSDLTNPIFTIMVGSSDHPKSRSEVVIFYSDIFYDYEYEKLQNFSIFSTEDGVKKVFDLIDVVAKAIRLTPFEPR